MTLNDFFAMLDEKNKYREYFTEIFSSLEQHFALKAIEKKGKNLVEVVEELKKRRLYPVVDKGLGVVLGVDTHMAFTSELFRYYYYADGLDREHVDPYECADRYVSEGYGYFISAMRPNIIVVGENYQPDQFDKDLFMMHEISSAGGDPLVNLALRRLSGMKLQEE